MSDTEAPTGIKNNTLYFDIMETSNILELSLKETNYQPQLINEKLLDLVYKGCYSEVPSDGLALLSDNCINYILTHNETLPETHVLCGLILMTRDIKKKLLELQTKSDTESKKNYNIYYFKLESVIKMLDSCCFFKKLTP
jgi:hypothetical protein